MYGLIFSHPFGQREGLPHEIPRSLHEGVTPTVLRNGRLSVTLWSIPATVQDPHRDLFAPQLCNRTSEDDTVFWSAWLLFRCDLDLSRVTSFSDLSPESSRLLGGLLETCQNKVDTSFEASLDRYRNSLRRVYTNNKSKIDNVLRERRRLKGQLSKLISGLKNMRLSQVWTVEDFARAVRSGGPFQNPYMTWSQVCSTKTQVPMLAVRLRNSESLMEEDLLLAAVRSMIANNVMHAISSQPILLHTVATVGGVLHQKAAVNLYGDFTALSRQGAFAKQCLIWVLRIDDPEFVDLWQEVHHLQWQVDGSLEEAIHKNRHRLWRLGETFAMASASQDLKVLRVLLEAKEYDDANQLVIPEVLRKGNHVYLAMLQPTHRAQFQFNSFRKVGDKDLSNPFQELMGRSTLVMPMCLQQIWGCDPETLNDRLSEEQREALKTILQTPRRLFTLSASAGAGKSYLFGAVLYLWKQWVARAHDTAGSMPIAIVATSRAQHREDLRRNILNFLPESEVFIMESMVDQDVEDVDNEVFWHAASSEEAKKRERAHWDRLRELDARIDRAQVPEMTRLTWVTERTALLWESILWVRGGIQQAFLQKLRVLVLTSDKLRKMLAASSSWFRQRPLGLLIQDEFENESFLDFSSLVAHFDIVITGGDPQQQLKKTFVPSLRLPGEGQAEEGITLEDETITPWLEQRSCLVQMRTSFRLGPEVLDIINEIFPEPFANSFQCAGRTTVCVIEVHDKWFHWDTGISLRTSITQNFAWSMFTCIALHALRASEKQQVAIISYYSAVLIAMSLHIANLAQAGLPTVSNGNMANIRFLTPEAAVGHTVEVVHFLACQPRRVGDSAPGGHQLELGRRYVSLTRASEELFVWVAKMNLSADPWTTSLQRFARNTTVDFDANSVPEVLLRIFDISIASDQAHSLWQTWRWRLPENMVRSCTEKLRRQAKAYDGVAATDFFDDPEMWLDVWGEMDWNPVPPALPRLEGIEQADEWQQNNPASQMTAYLVPFLPLHQFGKTAFFLPLLFFFPTATVHHWESSNADLFLPAVRVMRQTAMLLQQRGAQVEYNIEYHKLEQEEISGQTWFAKHCNAVRGACVLKDVSSERKPRVAKLYCGMGTEGTCPNNGFDEY